MDCRLWNGIKTRMYAKSKMATFRVSFLFPFSASSVGNSDISVRERLGMSQNWAPRLVISVAQKMLLVKCLDDSTNLFKATKLFLN